MKRCNVVVTQVVNSVVSVQKILLYTHWNGTNALFHKFIKSSQVPLRLTVSQSVSLGVEPHLGLMTRYLLLFDSYSLVFVGRPLWREDGSVFCICCWALPAQSFSGPSPLRFVTIFYCLTFKTSLFVASYDSQGHGGGIRPRLHTGDLIRHWFTIIVYITYGFEATVYSKFHCLVNKNSSD
jgi:hypothetical protein